MSSHSSITTTDNNNQTPRIEAVNSLALGASEEKAETAAPGAEEEVDKNAAAKNERKTKGTATTTTPVDEENEKEQEAGKNAENSYVAFVIDRSGSMSSMGCEVMTGFNTFLEEQQALPGTCGATVVRFDHSVEVLYHGVDIYDVEPADSLTFQPRGMTALHDAIGQTLHRVETHIDEMPEEIRPRRVMVMILTDGAENSSHEYRGADIAERIKTLEERRGWEFIFIGANQDAVSVGSSLGMKGANCLNFSASAEVGQQVFKNVSANAARYRKGGSSAFTMEERESSVMKTKSLFGGGGSRSKMIPKKKQLNLVSSRWRGREGHRKSSGSIRTKKFVKTASKSSSRAPTGATALAPESPKSSSWCQTQ